MLPDPFHTAEIREGPDFPAVRLLDASTEGLNGPEYGYTEDYTWIDQAYESAEREVEESLSAQHGGGTPEAGTAVSVSEPREVSSGASIRLGPRTNVHVENAISLAKVEIGYALHPIRVVWYWQPHESTGDEVLVFLKLSDDTGTFGEGFGLQRLRNESLMKDRIRRLYQDLLSAIVREH